MSEEIYTHKATDVLNRLKSALNIQSDSELCRLMNIPTNTFSNWKQRGQLNEKPIIAFCVRRNIDLNYIFGPESSDMHTPKIDQAGGHTPPVTPVSDMLVQSLLKNISLLEERLAISEATIKRAKDFEAQLIETQKELVKVQAQLLESQKKLDAALETIASLKKKKAA